SSRRGPCSACAPRAPTRPVRSTTCARRRDRCGARPTSPSSRSPSRRSASGTTRSSRACACCPPGRSARRSIRRTGACSPWDARGQPDSNDTAAAIEALRVAGVKGKPVARAVSFLRGFQRRDGGFELTHGRGSDAQSTAWAIQALVAAGVRPPRSAFTYLARLKREDGSYRYSARYVTTPVWVTSQVLAALAKRPFPL